MTTCAEGIDRQMLMREQEHTTGIMKDLDTKQQSADSFTMEIGLAKEIKTELPTHSFGKKIHCITLFNLIAMFSVCLE